MLNPEVFRKSGRFLVAPGREVSGELHVAGRGTSLYLRDDEEFNPHGIPGGCVTGVLHDLTRVTLIQCITLEGLGSSTRGSERYYFAKLFPHFVVEGRRHLEPNANVIVEITFVLEDATALFYDFDAFGTVIDATPYIEQLVAANKLDRSIPTGPEPQIVYFTGKRDIATVDTVLGKVRARHNPSWSLGGGPHGVRIANIITVSIEPDAPVAFDEAISRTLRLLRFLELIIGRPQNLQELGIVVIGGEHLEPLKVHWSYGPSRDGASMEETRSPQPADLLLDSIHRPEEFASVMRAWLEKDEERNDARNRFHTSFVQQSRYTVDRLVGAANMFDVLPKSAVPKDVELSDELRGAKECCRRIFEGLPDSYERSGILSALGRVGTASLKHKTRYRAQYVVDAIGERFPHLVSVLNEAIDCRNHYVHGSPPRFDYNEHFDMVTFFTDTLQFVFAAAELIEAGWSIRTFIETPTSMSHPFGAYRVNYDARREALEALVPRRR